MSIIEVILKRYLGPTPEHPRAPLHLGWSKQLLNFG